METIMSKSAHNTIPDRRTFLRSACCGAAGIAVARFAVTDGVKGAESKKSVSPPQAMPTVQIGGYTVSRLVLGANPVWGYSYQGKLLGRYMVDYYTDENILKLLKNAESAGITLWQGSYNKRLPDVWKRYKDEGGSMNLIMLHSYGDVSLREIGALKPIGIVHHGGVSDRLLVNNEFGKVHDFVREVKDMGLLAGVSCHRPAVIERVTEEDWAEVDLFMACFYQMTRSKEEWEKLIGFNPFQWVFHRDDPAAMCSVIRSVKKPVLGFKILAGGWAAEERDGAEKAFAFAYQNIKASDGVIVGFLPVFDDQISQNADYAIKYGQVS